MQEPKTSKAQLEGNKRYQSKTYRMPIYIPKEQKEPLEEYVKSKGFASLNEYTKHLIEKDSGLSMSIGAE